MVRPSGCSGRSVTDRSTTSAPRRSKLSVPPPPPGSSISQVPISGSSASMPERMPGRRASGADRAVLALRLGGQEPLVGGGEERARVGLRRGGQGQADGGRDRPGGTQLRVADSADEAVGQRAGGLLVD